MLQKELVTRPRNPATQNAKLLLKIPILSLREIWNNTAFFELDLAISDLG